MAKPQFNYAGTVTVEMAEQDYRNMTVAGPMSIITRCRACRCEILTISEERVTNAMPAHMKKEEEVFVDASQRLKQDNV